MKSKSEDSLSLPLRLRIVSHENGQTNLYSYYNNLGDQRLLQIQHLYPNGSFLSGFGYAYNAVGQIAAWTNQWDTLPAREWFPSYDAADQLTNVAVEGGSLPVTPTRFVCRSRWPHSAPVTHTI
jgi:hypothetical protein